MALTVKHAFISGKPAGPDPAKVQGPHWDAEHVIAGGPVGGTLVPIGVIQDYVGHTTPAGWLECAGQLVASALYSNLFAALVKSSTVTITIANPAVVTWANHGLAPLAPVTFYTTGALPTGIVSGTRYYVSYNGYAAGSFRLMATIGGPDIVTSGTQSGVHSVVYAPYGANSDLSQFNLPDLRDVVTAGLSNMAGSGLSLRLTSHQLGEIFGAEKTALLIENMPAHQHGGKTNTQDANHVHAVSGTISGATNAVDLSHAHATRFEYWGSASGGGGHNVLQPDFETGAAGSVDQGSGAANVSMNHAHSVSGSFSGGTGIENTTHKHAIAIQGDGVPHSSVQPTTLVRKIIYAGA